MERGGGCSVLTSSVIMFWLILHIFINMLLKIVCGVVGGGGSFLEHSFNFLYIYVVHMKKKYLFGEKERGHPPPPPCTDSTCLRYIVEKLKMC